MLTWSILRQIGDLLTRAEILETRYGLSLGADGKAATRGGDLFQTTPTDTLILDSVQAEGSLDEWKKILKIFQGRVSVLQKYRWATIDKKKG